MANRTRRMMSRKQSEAPTIQNYLLGFLQEKRANNLSPDTIKTYEEGIKRFISCLEARKIKPEATCLTKDIIEKYTQCLLETLSPFSVNRYLRALRVFTYWCQDNRGIEPFAIKMVRMDKAKPKVYSQDDLCSILRKPAQKQNFVEWRTWAVACFVFATAARVGSICAIKIEDLDFQTREVHIRKTKGRKQLDIPLTKALLPILQEYIALWHACTTRWTLTGHMALSTSWRASVPGRSGHEAVQSNLFGCQCGHGRACPASIDGFGGGR